MREIHRDMRELRGEMRELRDEIRAEQHFGNELLRRHEIAFVGMMKALGELREESRETRREAREGRKEIKAQTEAIFALIDEIRGGGAAAAT